MRIINWAMDFVIELHALMKFLLAARKVGLGSS